MEVLLPCPFCGEEANIQIQAGPYWQWSTRVECSNCHAKTSPVIYGNNGMINPEQCNDTGKEEAEEIVISRWNRRVQTKLTEVTHGKWMTKSFYSKGLAMHIRKTVCSCCGAEHEERPFGEPKYCEDCGAMMEGELI